MKSKSKFSEITGFPDERKGGIKVFDPRSWKNGVISFTKTKRTPQRTGLGED